jgi:hypothetical protein
MLKQVVRILTTRLERVDLYNMLPHASSMNFINYVKIKGLINLLIHAGWLAAGFLH